jgi:hypothetical protein
MLYRFARYFIVFVSVFAHEKVPPSVPDLIYIPLTRRTRDQAAYRFYTNRNMAEGLMLSRIISLIPSFAITVAETFSASNMNELKLNDS